MFNEFFSGEYKDGKKNGKGKLYFVDGDVKEGIWSNDHFID
jgi:hypothetical protein